MIRTLTDGEREILAELCREADDFVFEVPEGYEECDSCEGRGGEFNPKRDD